MDREVVFDLFSTHHLVTLVFLVLLGTMTLAASRTIASKVRPEVIGIIIAVVILLMEAFDRGYRVIVEGYFLKDNLPLHLCGMSMLVVPVMLITRSYLLFEVMYFWGLGGAAMAVLTPDTPFTFPHPLHVTFFLTHGLIIIGVLFACMYYKYRPTLKSIGKVFIITNVYAAMVFPINFILDTNYLFLREKPAGISLLDWLGPWPWYLLALEFVTVVIFIILYSPYFIKDLLQKARTARTSVGEIR